MAQSRGYSNRSAANGVGPNPGTEGPVSAAFRRDLADLAKRDADLARSGLAETALSLAFAMDTSESAHGLAQAANALMDIWDRLLQLAPVQEEHDDLDDLARRRAERIARSTAATS